MHVCGGATIFGRGSEHVAHQSAVPRYATLLCFLRLRKTPRALPPRMHHQFEAVATHLGMPTHTEVSHTGITSREAAIRITVRTSLPVEEVLGDG